MRIAPTLLLALSATLPAADVFMGPGQQTILREQHVDQSGIRTIYQDVHAPMVETMPGMGMVDDLELGIRGQTEHAWWSGVDDGQQDQGRQTNLDVLLRLRVCSWFATEVEGGALSGDFPDHYDFRNVDVRFAFSLMQERYRGAAIVLGAAMPISNSGAVLGYSHLHNIKRLAYLAELRWTESYGFNVFDLNVGGRWAPNVLNNIPAGLTVDGQPLAAGEQDNNTVMGTGRFGWSWRPSAIGRIGAEYVATVGRFEFSTTSHLTNHHQVVQAFIEADPYQGLSLQIFAGSLLERFSADSHTSSLVAGGQVRFGF